MAAASEQAATVSGTVDALMEALAPWQAGRRYANFAERSGCASDFYAAETLDRLRRLKGCYDPNDRIQASHPIVA